MEATFRWVAVTAIAPVAWGTTYFVTHQFLPADYPLYGAAIRALPAGLLLLLVYRKLPHGSWWWRSLVLGTLNMGAFFALIYLAAQTLPTSVASTIMATSPLVMMLFAWAAIAERPQAAHLAGAGIGIGGVCLLLLDGAAAVDASGVLASISAMVMSSLGYVLTKKWSTDVDVFSLTSWQLIAGGAVLVPVAAAMEGPPPTLDGPAIVGFGYVTVVATALAFAVWFTGLRHLSAGTVGLIGLLNPMTGVLLGTVIAGETLAGQQIFGLVLVFLGILLGHPGTGRLVAHVRAARTDQGTPRAIEPIHVDVNVGDPIWPAPQRVVLPRLLDGQMTLTEYPLAMPRQSRLDDVESQPSVCVAAYGVPAIGGQRSIRRRRCAKREDDDGVALQRFPAGLIGDSQIGVRRSGPS